MAKAVGAKDKNRMATPKQQAVANAILRGELETRTKQEILVASGYSTAVASVDTAKIFSSDGVKKALIAQGVDLEVLTKPAIDAMQAKKGSFYQGQYYDTDEPDHIVRLKGAEQLQSITGLQKTVVENHNVNVNVDYGEIAGVFGEG